MTEPEDFLQDALYFRLSEEAERARWRMEDIPWSRIEHDKASDELVSFVRTVASSELTTFSASRKFMHEFADDPDFTQWVSVWFYEETRHPHALIRWLHHFGQTVDTHFLLKGRLTTPFMKSRMGTFVTNVISEITASTSYMNLSRNASEPVLALIARNLAADEARHAAGFFSYAERHLRRASDPVAERMTALKVLYLWLTDSSHVGHPVNQLRERRANQPDPEEIASVAANSLAVAQRRARTMIGYLVGAEIGSTEEIMVLLKQLAASAGRPVDEAQPSGR